MAIKNQTMQEEELRLINLDNGNYPDERFTFLFCSRPDVLGMGVNKSYCVGTRKLVLNTFKGGKSVLLHCNSSDASSDIRTKSLRKRFSEYKDTTGKKDKKDKKDNNDINDDKVKISREL